MTEHSEPKSYDVEVPVAADRYEVWEALTQPPVLRQWFGWDHPGLDDEIQQIFVGEAVLTAPQRMGWSDGSFLEVAGDAERSTVRAVREGDPDADPNGYDAMEEGWRMFFAQLRYLLEERPKGARRTVYLSGAATGSAVLTLIGGELTRLDDRVVQVVTGAGHLVLIAGEQPLDSPEEGLVQVVISTFGLDGEAFAEVLGRWAADWPPVARNAEITVAPAA